MKGLRLISTVVIQVEVATRKAALRAGPAGKKPQAHMAIAAQHSSAVTPAIPMARRWRRAVSFHESFTSV